MTLPTSGQISFSNINTELGRTTSNLLSLSDNGARSLAQDTTGDISLSTFHGRSALSASASPTTVTGSCDDIGGGCTATTGTTSVVVNGGTGVINYQWEHVSGPILNITTPTSSSTSFATTAEQSSSSVYRCSVTRNGNTVFSNNVTVNINITMGGNIGV